MRRYADSLKKRIPEISRDHASEFSVATRHDPREVRETGETLIRDGSIKNLGVQGVVEAARALVA